MTIGFIGAGKMGEAIIRAISRANIVRNTDIYVNDKDAKKADALADELKVNSVSINNALGCDIVFMAVKPQDFINLNLVSCKKSAIIISIMAGVKIENIKKATSCSKVVRVMPNLCATIGESTSAYSCSKEVSVQEKETVENLLKSFGIAFEVKESLLDAVTGVSGSGPAYVAYMINALAKAAAKQGIDEKKALMMSIQTFLGTAKLLKAKEIAPEELINSVSSKGGTTVAGMGILSNSGFEKIIEETAEKAAKRSMELGK